MRTALSRFLLIVLLGLAIAAAVRSGESASGAVVSIDDVMTDDLEHEAFRMREAGVVSVQAAGSFEEAGTAASDTTLAALAWIVRRDDGAVVWRMRPPRPDRGTFAAVEDSVALPAGVYDAYVASFGDPLARAPAPRGGSLGERLRTALNRTGRAWRGDAGRWRLVVRGGGEAERASEDFEDPPSDSGFVWRATRVRSGDRREALFRVAEPTRVRLRALVEVPDGVLADSAFVVRLGARDTAWAVRPEQTAWAGGSLKNRVATGEVALEPGFYRAVYAADRDHAYGSWTANPPWAPWQWGLTVEGGAAITPLDPDAVDLPEIASIRCAGPDEELERTFALDEPTDVLAVAVGEVVDGSRYDFGGLDRKAGPDDWDEVWEMPRRGLEPAGGSEKNRRAVAALSLRPGTYRVRYETDGSHDCAGGYNAERPDGGLWGIALYAFDPDFDPATVRLAAPPTGGGAVLAEVEAGGAGAMFTVEPGVEVEVASTGVISDDEAYEYASITDEGGAVVWAMTWANTTPVDRLPLIRRHSGSVPLAPGTYTLRYRTDDHPFDAVLDPVIVNEETAYRGARVVRVR